MNILDYIVIVLLIKKITLLFFINIFTTNNKFNI